MIQANFRSWMLPEGVVEALPGEAIKLNYLESVALSTFFLWGYQPLRPPMIEYADTFLSNGNDDYLSQQTIQFKDQKSGKQLGFRADITPQVARIDAHYLKTDKVSRYAYSGEVVRSYPTGHGSVRNPTVVGAELLGSNSQQADVEMVSLLIEYLRAIGVRDFVIELGNVDIVVELLLRLGVAEIQHALFFDALSKKDKEKVLSLSERSGLASEQSRQIVHLIDCYGSIDIIEAGLLEFSCYTNVIGEIQRLKQLYMAISAQYPEVALHVDFSDVRGYGYHNGVIFSAYLPDVWQPIARGGRYDGFGNHFGEKQQQRASIGFNCHLNLLTRHLALDNDKSGIIICNLTKWDASLHTSLHDYVRRLRGQGNTVILIFDDGISPVQNASYSVDRKNSDWTLSPIG